MCVVSKVCNGCHENLPIGNFYKDKQTKTGYQHRCKECTKKRRLKNRVIAPIKKTCLKCNETLSISQFWSSKYAKDGYMTNCKKCINKKKNTKFNHKCGVCRNDFESSKDSSKYCSYKCYGIAQRKRVIVNCAFCGNETEVHESKPPKYKNLYCNKKCCDLHKPTTMMGEDHPRYIRVKRECDGCGTTIMMLPSESKNRERTYCTPECRTKNSWKFMSGDLHHRYNRIKHNCLNCDADILRIPSSIGERMYCDRSCRTEHMHGENNHGWNHNLSQEDRERGRNYQEYRDWRTSVFKKNHYTCQCCGQKGGSIHAHHIRNYADNPLLRTEISNGAVLCQQCHINFHISYGKRHNNQAQLDEFIASF